MFKKNCVIFLPLIMIFLLFLAAGALASEDTAESSQTFHPTGWISNGEHLGRWWSERAKKQDPMPAALLYHIEAEYSFSKSTGNQEITNHKAAGNLILRKNIVTASTMYELKDNDNEYRGSTIKTKKQTLGESFFIEIFDKMDISGGCMWTQDDKKYIENRYLYYGGLYFTLLSTEKFKLKAGTYYGYSQMEYQKDKLEEIAPGEDFSDFNSDLVYFDQKFNWSITKNIIFSENLVYRHYLKNTDYYRWSVKLGMEFIVTKNISLTCSYKTEYDENKLVDIKGLEKEDTDFDFGIKLSF